MLILRRILPLLIVAVLAVVAWSGYRSDNAGQRLFDEFFDPQGPIGYPNGRVSADLEVPDQDPSLLRQLIAYHKAADYPAALAATRAYLESNPTTPDPRPYLLGGTAAAEVGEFDYATYLLGEMPVTGTERQRAVRDWYLALLLTRVEEYERALVILETGEVVVPRDELLNRIRRLTAS